MKGYRLADRLAVQRQVAGLTQQEVADRAEISYSYYCRLEKGLSKFPSLDKASALAEVLGCSVDYLAGRTDTPRGAA